MAAAQQMETAHIVQDGVVDSRLGTLLQRGRDYRLPKAHADIRYQRGHARPAAEVYLERLREMGVVAVTISKDAEPSIRLAGQKAGVVVKGQGK